MDLLSIAALVVTAIPGVMMVRTWRSGPAATAAAGRVVALALVD